MTQAGIAPVTYDKGSNVALVDTRVTEWTTEVLVPGVGVLSMSVGRGVGSGWGRWESGSRVDLRTGGEG